MNVSCPRSSTPLSTAPPAARKRASAGACRRTNSAAACSSPPCQAAISAASDGTTATGSAGDMRRYGRRDSSGEIKPVPPLKSPALAPSFHFRTIVRTHAALRRAAGPVPLPSGEGVRRPGLPLHHDAGPRRSEEHTSELQSRLHLVCRLLLEKK